MNDLLAKIRKIIGILCFLNEKLEKSGISDLSVEDTLVRKNSNIFGFSLTYSYL